VKKLLQSQKITWQQIPILSIGSAQASYLISANITPQMSSIANSIIGSMTLNYTTPIYSIHANSLDEIMKSDKETRDNFLKSGIYREKSKFVVIFVERTDEFPEPKIYHLGRFDTEEEARRTFQKVSCTLKLPSIFLFHSFFPFL
jgi:hypothetical protein